MGNWTILDINAVLVLNVLIILESKLLTNLTVGPVKVLK